MSRNKQHFKGEHYKKFFIVVLLSLFVFAIGSDAVTGEPMPPPTSMPLTQDFREENLSDIALTPKRSTIVTSIDFVDPLYGYSITLPTDWHILPSPSGALYGVTVLMNYDPDLIEFNHGNLPQDAIKIQIGVAPLVESTSFEDWVKRWVDFELQSGNSEEIIQKVTEPTNMIIGDHQAYGFEITGPSGEKTYEYDILLSTNQIMIVGIFFNYSEVDLDNIISILETAQAEKNHVFPDEIMETAYEVAKTPIPSNFYFGSLDELLNPSCTSVGTFPGTEAPNSPISLYLPFSYGEEWVVGGSGSFYGNWAHCNVYHDYYATDWNRPNGDDYGRNVLPVADGSIVEYNNTNCVNTYPNGGYGCYVKVNHSSGIQTLYGHLSGVAQTSGSVSHNDVIGYVGNSGNSTSTHLHLAFRAYDSSQGYVSHCWNNGATCPNQDVPLQPQSPKPSPIQTLHGIQTLVDGTHYWSNNGNGGSTCNPSSNEVALFVDPGYDGQCVIRGIGDYLNPSSIGLPNDSISSIRVGSNVEAMLCRDDNYGGICEIFTDDDSNLVDNNIGDNHVSSVRVQYLGGSTETRLYDNTNYGGSYTYVSTVGLYTMVGIFNDMAESITMPSGWSVRLFQNANYYGPQVCIQGNDSDLWNNYYDNGDVVANSATWIEVYNQSACPPIISVPNPPTLQSPVNGASLSTTTNVILDWNSSSGATEYYAHLWGGPNIDINSGWIGGTDWNIGTLWAGIYQWQVKARNQSGESGWSATWTFVVVPPCPTITEWRGEYWNNPDLSGLPSLCRNDAILNFAWQDNSPDPVINSDQFSSRWTRDVSFSAGNYTFYITHDDGGRLYIDNVLEFENWCSNCSMTESIELTLSPGTHNLVMEYYENSGWASAGLSWLQAFNKLMPANGATNISINPTLIWGASVGATSYAYCYDTSNNNTCNGAWTSAGTNTSISLSGLANNTTYYWHVRASNSNGTIYSNNDSWWSFTTVVAPPVAFNKLTPPNGATNIATNPTLTWGTSSGATSYEYCYDTSNNDTCNGTWMSTGSITSIILSNLQNNTTYYWHVRSVNAGGTTYSNSDSWWSFTTIVAPPATFNKLSPSNGATGVVTNPNLTWATSSGATIYEYCYDTSDNGTCDGTWTSAGSNTSVSLSSLQNNTTYYWHVRANNASGTTYSNGNIWWSFTTVMSPPSAFNKLTPSNGSIGVATNASLAWAASSGATSYEYCYDTSNNDTCNGTWTSTDSNTSVSLSGLQNSTTYYWHVRANNAGGTIYSNGNAWWSFTTAYPACPTIAEWRGEYWNNPDLSGPPVLCRNDVDIDFTWESSSPDPLINPDQFSARWTRDASFLSGTYTFTISYDDGARLYIDNVLVFEDWCTSCIATENVALPMTSGTHNIVMEYHEISGWASAALSWQLAAPATFNKLTPSNGSSGVPTNASLTWAVSSGATSYEYCYDTSNNGTCNGNWISTGNNTSVSLGNLQNNTTYYWHVRSLNPGGTTYSNGNIWWNFTTIIAPPAAFNKQTPSNGATGVATNPTLIWVASSGAISYEYCYDTSNNGTCDGTWTSTGSNTSTSLSSLQNNTIYYWHVRANNAGGTTYSNGNIWWSFATQVAPPGAFNKLTPSNGASGVTTNPTLSWATSSGATSYEYCYDTSNNGTCNSSWISTGNNTSVSLSSLQNNTTYYWHVRALNPGGNTYSNGNTWWNFTTIVSPPAAFNKLTPSNGATGIASNPSLIWATSSGATSYEYCYDTSNNSTCNGTWIDTSSSTSVSLSGLQNNTTYYWHVRAINAGGTTYSNGNIWWSFTTITCSPNTDQIALFVDNNYSGQCVTKNLGDYPNASSIGLPDNSVSSIRVGSNVQAILCREVNYGGVCETFTNDDSNLADNPIGTDHVSSMRVQTGSGGNCPTITEWQGEYWNNPDLSGPPALCRNDVNINFTWESNSPDPLINPDQFSARWTRDVGFVSGTYTFTINYDDGARLYVDNVLVFEDWCNNCSTSESVAVPMTSGVHNIVMEYHEISGWASAALSWQLAPPAVFNKLTPSNGASGVMTNPALTWAASSGATSYEYCYDTSNDNTCNGIWTGTGSNTSVSLSGLQNNATYYWHVRAINTGGTTYSNNGTWWSFTTIVEAPGAFNKVTPSNGATGAATNLTLTWAASSGAISYEYCYDTSNNSACNSTWTSTGSNTSVSLSGLQNSTTYYWHVRAINVGGTTYSNTDTWWGFTTIVAAPAAFNKLTPSNGASGIATSPILAWAASSGATSYEYCYDESDNSACSGTWTSTGSNTSVSLTGLQNNTTYYWHVRAINAGGTTYSNSNAWWSFTTDSSTEYYIYLPSVLRP